MKVKFIWLALTIFGLAVLYQMSTAAPTSAVYYVCDCQTNADGDCVAGSDSNAGVDPNAPWQTYGQAKSFFNSSISAGDEIRFCQGGSFDLGVGSPRWGTTFCTAEQPCVIADYAPPWASGDEARPILSKNSEGHGFYIADGGDAQHDEGYTFQNLDLRCPGCVSSNAWGFFFFNDINDLLIENVSIDGFGIGIHLAGANSCVPSDGLCNGRNDRVTIRNVNIQNNMSQGILGAADDLIIEDSYFQNNGGGTVFDHNIYISNSDRVIIRNNELYQSSLNGSGNCNGTSLVVHGVVNDLLIEGNYIHEDVGQAEQACWGIGVDTGYNTAESFTNVVIRANRVEHVGNTSIGASACLTCTIENNVVVSQQGFGTLGVAVPDKATGSEDAVSTNVTVRNNSIATLTGGGIRLNAGSGHTIVSNAIQALSSDGGWDCLEATLPASSYQAVDYNICHFSAGEWTDGAGDLAAWQAQGWGAHSQAANPGFTSAVDLRPLLETAVLVNAGHPTLSSPIEFNGYYRPNPPSVGAYEWKALLPEIWLPFVTND